MNDSKCIECGKAHDGHRAICSTECDTARRRRHSREWAKRNYVPRTKSHVHRSCDQCGASFSPNRNTQRFCGSVCQKASSRDFVRGRRQESGRSCIHCGAEGLPFRPGRAVCDDCRSDKRGRRDADGRRRFRKYGITEAQYTAKFAEQGGCCAICLTDDPGSKGWTIDHCHDTDTFRGVLCNHCNLALGHLRDDVGVMLRAVDYIQSSRD